MEYPLWEITHKRSMDSLERLNPSSDGIPALGLLLGTRAILEQVLILLLMEYPLWVDSSS